MAVTIDGNLGVTSPDFEPSSSTVPTNGLFLPTTNTLAWATNSTERLRLDASGNLGVGTSSPSFSGGSRIALTVNAPTGQFPILELGVNNSLQGYVYANASQLTINKQGANPITFETNGSERARIDSSGNLLVGTTSNPNNARLYARYDGISTQINCNSASTSSASTNWSHFVGQSGNGSSITTNNIFIYGNGNIQNANNSYGAISDESLKENIIDATPKLADLLKVKVKTYNLIGDYENHKQIGVIAQELEKVFPSMVETNNEGLKSVKYSVFVPMLIKAIQELTARLEALEDK